MPSRLSYKPHYRRNLPHLQPPGATLFVTYRLAGSLPVTLLQRWQDELKAREQLLEALPPIEQGQKRHEEQKRFFNRYDTELDRAAHGPTWLRDPAIAAIVLKSLRELDGQLYELEAFTIMANHVHVVLTPMSLDDDGYVALPRIMYELKKPTAWDANSLLGRTGKFWQHESFDHYIRDQEEHERVVRYILNNPIKAGLVDSWDEWPWTYWKYAP